MMLFSATYNLTVMEFAQHIVKNPIVIKLMREQESLDNIMQYYVHCRSQDEKYQAIQNIYGVITIGQAIIFCHVIFQTIQFCFALSVAHKSEVIILTYSFIDSKNSQLAIDKNDQRWAFGCGIVG